MEPWNWSHWRVDQLIITHLLIISSNHPGFKRSRLPVHLCLNINHPWYSVPLEFVFSISSQVFLVDFVLTSPISFKVPSVVFEFHSQSGSFPMTGNPKPSPLTCPSSVITSIQKLQSVRIQAVFLPSITNPSGQTPPELKTQNLSSFVIYSASSESCSPLSPTTRKTSFSNVSFSSINFIHFFFLPLESILYVGQNHDKSIRTRYIKCLQVTLNPSKH